LLSYFWGLFHKELEDENRRLKKLVADQALDIQMLKEINSKNW